MVTPKNYQYLTINFDLTFQAFLLFKLNIEKLSILSN